jgi:hypothetical protein
MKHSPPWEVGNSPAHQYIPCAYGTWKFIFVFMMVIGYYVNSSVLWVVTSCSSESRQKQATSLALLDSCLISSSTLKSVVIYSSDTSGSLRTQRPYNPENRTLRSHRCENLRPNSTAFSELLSELSFCNAGNSIDSKGFSRGCVILRITGCSDFVHRPIFWKLENTMFRKLDLFPSSGEGVDTYSVGSLRDS